MSSTCTKIRKHLTADADATRSPEIAAHLEDCETCARYSVRLDGARRLFEMHHSGVEPDGAFVARVTERLPVQQPTDALGQAALRLLPASLALVAVLTFLALRTGPAPVAVVQVEDDPLDDFISWVIEDDGAE